MDHTLLHHRLPIKDFIPDATVGRMAAPLQVLHSERGQLFLVAGVRHMSAEKAWQTLRGINREACGAAHHLQMPRGQSARRDKATQNNTLKCAHGSQLPLQQALVAAAVLKIIPPDVLYEYVRIRAIQKKVLLDADDLLTSGYAIAAREKNDAGSREHLRRMGLPVIGVTTAQVGDWMCCRQDTTAEPIIAIMDRVIAGLEGRFPELLEEKE